MALGDNSNSVNVSPSKLRRGVRAEEVSLPQLIVDILTHRRVQLQTACSCLRRLGGLPCQSRSLRPCTIASTNSGSGWPHKAIAHAGTRSGEKQSPRSPNTTPRVVVGGGGGGGGVAAAAEGVRRIRKGSDHRSLCDKLQVMHVPAHP